MIELAPAKKTPIDQRVCPAPAALPPRYESGGYAVQPAEAAPPATKNENVRMMNAGHIIQYDSALRSGNAMSRAPIISGMQKFPNAPTSSGMMTKKIITDACIVNAML